MDPETVTQMRPPPSLRGVPPRYQVFDRRKSPPQSSGRFYRDPDRDAVVFEVYEDLFREFLKRSEALEGKHFDWIVDVDPDAPHGTRGAIVRSHPMPAPACHDPESAETLTLEEALDAVRAEEFYRVVRASDPV
ncbi:MAG: hypothetical protein R3199_05685 [Gemmatimonadota bacterium]|nr:hypothetical protein [Gemmatimonadota bacterium]